MDFIYSLYGLSVLFAVCAGMSIAKSHKGMCADCVRREKRSVYMQTAGFGLLLVVFFNYAWVTFGFINTFMLLVSVPTTIAILSILGLVGYVIGRKYEHVLYVPR